MTTSLETTADNILRDMPKGWQGWALVVTNTPLLERVPKTRSTTRDKALRRLLETAATLLDRMEVLARAGSDEPASLESIIHHSDFHDCLFIAQWPETLRETIVGRLRAGDNVCEVVRTSVVKVTFHRDPTHCRIW